MTVPGSFQRRAVPIIAIALLAVWALASAGGARAQSTTTVEVFASGLINPKGMAFTSDGTLYIAESGAPGDVMVPLPVNFGGEGPIGTNGRISKVPPGGTREDFVTGLPNIGLYGGVEMLGAGSVEVLDDQLYEVAAGHMTVSPLLSRVDPDGTMHTIADVGAFNDANPPPPTNGDAVPMGNPYDMAALDGDLYISDGNYNRVLKATLDGELSIFAAWEYSPVTVGIAAGPDGNLYVCQFSPAPYYPGNGRIDRVAPDGTITEGAVTNLTTPIDVAFAPDGTMYVLQYAAEFDNTIKRYVAFGGEVQRVNDDGSVAPVVTNLVFPTALTFGPDGALYVTNYGNESNDGQGQVLRVVPGDTPAPAPDVPPPSEEGSYVVPTREPISDESAEPTREPVATIDIVEPPGDPLEVWGYDPTELTVNVGDTVTFTNAGRIEHTATATNGDFDTGKLATDASWNVTFDEPGTIEYYCIPHPWMEGAITVVGQGSGDGQEEVASFGGDTDPPRISFWMAAVFVGVIIAAIFAAGYAMRRRGDVTSDGRVTSDE